MSNVWVQKVEGDIWGWGKKCKGFVGRGQLILSMGQVWREVRIFAQRATTPGQGLFCFNCHTCIDSSLCCKYVLCAIHIFLRCSLKINHVTEIQNMRLFLGPLDWLQTGYLYTFLLSYNAPNTDGSSTCYEWIISEHTINR
jgi:hypothetical protein